MPDKDKLSEIEDLEELICEDMELGVLPSIALQERCEEARTKCALPL
ncbi:MAG: hypothetical protein SOV63_08905 [Pyramidobacter porci]|nr:hypothetical protein [Pyramidobacter porci]MDY2648908.1 hypothetical protein [Pyramidobacter porci]